MTRSEIQHPLRACASKDIRHTAMLHEILLAFSKVVFHLSGLAGPDNQFLNGMYEFSELVLARMVQRVS